MTAFSAHPCESMSDVAPKNINEEQGSADLRSNGEGTRWMMLDNLGSCLPVYYLGLCSCAHEDAKSAWW